ncbi:MULTISPECIES: hypothetical protein [Aeromicrobium]|uniref:hypothetical protein n=1 Tax=Aeromicrobium TaxID=2040 RepID=UPI00257C5FD4|nr:MULTISPECIES: hypothetical protein [Aeromicrobium]
MGASETPDLRHDGGHGVQDRASERNTDAVAPGQPTKRGGQFLRGLMVLTAVVWVFSFVQLVQQPSQEGSTTTSWDLAFWVAMALGSAIATFILGFWKVHRT